MKQCILMVLVAAVLAVGSVVSLKAQDTPRSPGSPSEAAPAPGAPLVLPALPADPTDGPAVGQALPHAARPSMPQPQPQPQPQPRTSGPRAWTAPGSMAAPFAGLGRPGAAPAAPAASTAAREDIRDIRGPVHMPEAFAWSWIAGGVAAALALAALAYAVYRLRKRALTRARLAHEVAFEALEKARTLLEAGEARAFAYAVSDAVRRYLEQRFRLAAGRRTTEEFMTELTDPDRTPAVLAAHRDRLGDFLGYCDFGKFARGALTVEQMESMLASARRFVSATRYREEEAQPKASDRDQDQENSNGRAGRKARNKNRKIRKKNSTGTTGQNEARACDEPVMGGVS